MSTIEWKIKPFEKLSGAEVYEILKMRQEVFIIEQHCIYPDIDEEDFFGLHFWAECQGQVIAYCRIFPAKVTYEEVSLGRVLTSKAWRAKGVGKNLIFLAIQLIEARFKTRKIRISAQDYLLAFYGNFGFRSTGNSYLEDGIPHTEMLRE